MKAGGGILGMFICDSDHPGKGGSTAGPHWFDASSVTRRILDHRDGISPVYLLLLQRGMNNFAARLGGGVFIGTQKLGITVKPECHTVEVFFRQFDAVVLRA